MFDCIWPQAGGHYYKQARDTVEFDMLQFTRRMDVVTLDEVDGNVDRSWKDGVIALS